jgi:hypothetical protein
VRFQHRVADSGNSGPASATLSNTITIDSGFTGGLMALDFIVYNAPQDDGLNPSGLRVQILSATASDTPPAPVPEPSTWALFGAGLLILAIHARRGRGTSLR